MLPQTEINKQQIIDKIQLLDRLTISLGSCHKDDTEDVNKVLKRMSKHRIKLVNELITLSGVDQITMAVT